MPDKDKSQLEAELAKYEELLREANASDDLTKALEYVDIVGDLRKRLLAEAARETEDSIRKLRKEP